MPLKFYCNNCSDEIYTKYLKIGEYAQCKKCKHSMPVPDNAMNISMEEYNYIKEELNKKEESKEVLNIREQTHEYLFIEQEIDNGFFNSKLPGKYKDIIIQKAKEGWRFKQIFPIKYSGSYSGLPQIFQMIFERKIN